jgi:hypothetical protein
MVSLPPAYERVLRLWGHSAPRATARARTALATLFDDLLRSEDPRAFGRSSLTMTGSPFEPALSLVDPGLRYTVEPCPGHVPARERLERCLLLLGRLNVVVPRPELISTLAALQARGPLRYGAQIGARHSDSSDVYKLYVELPREARAEAEGIGRELLGSAAVLDVPGRDARPTLLGIELSSGKLELYYRIEHLHPLEISTLLRRANAAERAGEVLAMLGASQPLPIRHVLPGATWGFSYAVGSAAEVTFSLYTFARTLFGPDGWIREGLLAMGRRYGWDLDGYARMSEPLSGRRGLPCHHGIFGLIVPPHAAPAAWIGLAPVEHRA